jgi:hypothetical protein
MRDKLTESAGATLLVSRLGLAHRFLAIIVFKSMSGFDSKVGIAMPLP